MDRNSRPTSGRRCGRAKVLTVNLEVLGQHLEKEPAEVSLGVPEPALRSPIYRECEGVSDSEVGEVLVNRVGCAVLGPIRLHGQKADSLPGSGPKKLIEDRFT
ncbi:hypothetical protein [Mycolicibacterium holsaticum]|uniref:hypothetical protein n=1 Tax=Mycolicibacterium holsaticum TaxID=152142 RepID=UPI00223D7FC0|nr:hypothetical protein [Mycolicibacterium holsaticum]UNC10747.1 hypothetical protein H5U41_05150 [Mycolicibacterium holsaticum DSM 44478 = JCM 12374]